MWLCPITEFICRYSNKINIKLNIADINQINNHYADGAYLRGQFYINKTL